MLSIVLKKEEAVQFMDVLTAAKKWSLTERRVIALLRAGRVKGAVKNGHSWQIPSDAVKPYDKRAKYSRYEKPARRSVVAGIDTDIGRDLAAILTDNNFEVIGFKRAECADAKSAAAKCAAINGFIDGFAFVNLDSGADIAQSLVRDILPAHAMAEGLIDKMNYQSGMVLINSAASPARAAHEDIVKSWAPKLAQIAGTRINSLTITGGAAGAGDTLYMSREIADEAFLLMTRHSRTTGSSVFSDGGAIAIDKSGQSEDLDNGQLYAWIHKSFSDIKPGGHVWAISTMMDNEWTDDAMERQFKRDNLDAVQRGVKLTRIFIFSRKNARRFKDNPNIVVYITNAKAETLFVDMDELRKKHYSLLREIGDGWIAFGDDRLFMDIIGWEYGRPRAYLTIDKKTIAAKKKIFAELKKLSVPLKTVVK